MTGVQTCALPISQPHFALFRGSVHPCILQPFEQRGTEDRSTGAPSQKLPYVLLETRLRPRYVDAIVLEERDKIARTVVEEGKQDVLDRDLAVTGGDTLPGRALECATAGFIELGNEGTRFDEEHDGLSESRLLRAQAQTGALNLAFTGRR